MGRGFTAGLLALLGACGSPADLGRVCPAQAAVVDGRPAEDNETFATVRVGRGCTGVLVAPLVVLTAAHCHGGAGYVERDGQIVSVWDRIQHPDYVPVGLENDIEVLILYNPMAPPYATVTSPRLAGVEIAGYGETNDGSAGVLHLGATYIDSISHTTFTTNPLGADSCFGDSGGPLYQGGKVVGLTSRAREGGHNTCGSGSVNVAIDAYADWLAEVTGDAVQFENLSACK